MAERAGERAGTMHVVAQELLEEAEGRAWYQGSALGGTAARSVWPLTVKLSRSTTVLPLPVFRASPVYETAAPA